MSGKVGAGDILPGAESRSQLSFFSWASLEGPAEQVLESYDWKGERGYILERQDFYRTIDRFQHYDVTLRTCRAVFPAPSPSWGSTAVPVSSVHVLIKLRIASSSLGT